MNALLQELVTAQADNRPDGIAILAVDRRWTYAEVESHSNRLGRALREAGCDRGDRVCLLSAKTPQTIMALLAIYKADGVYVPLDPETQPARLAKIIRSCEPRCIIASGAMLPLLDDILEDQPARSLPIVVSLEQHSLRGRRFTSRFSSDDVRHMSDRTLSYRNRAAGPAHILFKSSNGSPKGVVITHDNVRHFVNWAIEYFGVTPDDRQSGDAPLGRDLSLYDLFGTLGAGATLCLSPVDTASSPARIAEFIAKASLTQWCSVPSVLASMAAASVVDAVKFAALKRVLWCGDTLTVTDLRTWMTRVPHVTFTNLYGPAETTIASSYYTLPELPAAASEAIPIGVPVPGEELYVLDERLEPVPDEHVGEIYVRGVGLSPGYWRNPDATQAAFLPNPNSADPSDRLFKTGDLGRRGTDGLMYLAGRRTTKVERGGRQIELGEIEAALGTLPSIREAAVVAVPIRGGEGATICCAYVTATGWRVTAAGLRQQLAKILPPYMLPSRWRALDRLPHDCDGQPDRSIVLEWFTGHIVAAR